MSEQKKTTESQTATEGSSSRTITIVSTRGEKKKIEFAGNEWSDLKKIIQKEGYNLDNMKCVESVNRTTLEHPQAVVPAGNFNLFLMPVKSKSGAGLSRSELYNKIKEFSAKNESAAKEHFGNYTQKKTSDLEQLVESYSPGTTSKASKEKAEAITDVVESVKNSKGDGQEVLANLAGLSVEEKLDIVIAMLVDIRGGSNVSTAEVAEKSQAEIDEENKKKAEQEEADRKKKEEEARRKEEERKQREEDEKLEKEMRDLAGGFGDVRL